MRILAIDSSGLVATVALLEDSSMIAEYTMNYKKTHSQTLLHMIDEIIQQTDFDKNSIDAIAVAAGPGSFTGLRIGCATAKGLGLALEKPIIPVPTVDGLAYNMAGVSKLVCPLMDARRNQVYTAAYEVKDGRLVEVIKEEPMDIKDLIDKVIGLGKQILFLGDGVAVYRDILEEHLKDKAFFAKEHNMVQRASSLAVLAKDKWEQRVSAKEFHLEYLRASQAEREWKEEHQGEELPCLS